MTTASIFHPANKGKAVLVHRPANPEGFDPATGNYGPTTGRRDPVTHTRHDSERDAALAAPSDLKFDYLPTRAYWRSEDPVTGATWIIICPDSTTLPAEVK